VGQQLLLALQQLRNATIRQLLESPTSEDIKIHKEAVCGQEKVSQEISSEGHGSSGRPAALRPLTAQKEAWPRQPGSRQPK